MQVYLGICKRTRVHVSVCACVCALIACMRAWCVYDYYIAVDIKMSFERVCVCM